jgi:D-lactate dehydrogenase
MPSAPTTTDEAAAWRAHNPRMPLPAELHRELAALLGEGQGWLTDPGERLAYAYDNSRREALPDAVALPLTREQVQALVGACFSHRIPIVARGRGTNTTGASVPVQGGVVVSFERMNRILDIRPGDRCAVVEPGVLNGDLQAALQSHRLFWPPDPTSAAFSTVGGNLACNAGGPRAVKYGASRDNVLALTAITGTGELVHCGSATTKGATGYDLQRLLVGSEGTLALIVEATLKLTPLLIHVHAVRAAVGSLDRACEAAGYRLITQATDGPAEVDARQCAQDLGGGKSTEAHQKSVGTSRNSTAHRRASPTSRSISGELSRRFAQGAKIG